jgi:hypothetical protein
MSTIIRKYVVQQFSCNDSVVNADSTFEWRDVPRAAYPLQDLAIEDAKRRGEQQEITRNPFIRGYRLVLRTIVSADEPL